MKFSTATLVFLAAFVNPCDATQDAVEAVGTQELDNHSWTDIYSRLRIGVNGVKKRPDAADISFLGQAMKRAYNSVHAPLDDDYDFLDFNCTAVEMQAEEADTAELLLNNVYENMERLSRSYRRRRRYVPPRGWRLSGYGISDIACNLCADDDDALGLRSGTNALTTKPPFAGIKPVEEMLCQILKKEGSKSVFSEVHGCSIFQFDSLGSWEYEETNDPQVATSAAPHETMISIELSGLSCDEKENFVECHDDLLRQIVSDALVVAYNKVNFADDFFLSEFVPASIELYRGDDVNLALRGATTLAPVGHFRGIARVQCRACDDDIDCEDPVMAPFYKLNQVETTFCEMLSSIAKETPALASLQACSLSVVPIVETDVTAVTLDID